MALWVLPNVLSKQEDVFGQEDMKGDISDPKVLEAIMVEFRKKARIMFDNQPQIKKVIQGTLLDMVDRGLLELSI